MDREYRTLPLSFNAQGILSDIYENRDKTRLGESEERSRPAHCRQQYFLPSLEHSALHQGGEHNQERTRAGIDGDGLSAAGRIGPGLFECADAVSHGDPAGEKGGYGFPYLLSAERGHCQWEPLGWRLHGIARPEFFDQA